MHLDAHSLEASGAITPHVVRLHVTVAKVITAKLYITLMAPIPTVILVDQGAIPIFEGALKDCGDFKKNYKLDQAWSN
jgi:hypothetical protein